ncbi:MAG: hypothetical protein PHV62_05940 [Sulfuricurvum sp.]|nr:hypothetical protein [Sulfuricurvum sp.]
MQYYLSNNDGRLTIPISKFTAIRYLLMRTYPCAMEFGEMRYVEDENGTLLYKKAWFEKRPSKVNPYPSDKEGDVS